MLFAWGAIVEKIQVLGIYISFFFNPTIVYLIELK